MKPLGKRITALDRLYGDSNVVVLINFDDEPEPVLRDRWQAEHGRKITDADIVLVVSFKP
ncbi:MAG: hypothetical protein ACU836_14035 [Gammaproteobacteria bacterium]